MLIWGNLIVGVAGRKEDDRGSSWRIRYLDIHFLLWYGHRDAMEPTTRMQREDPRFNNTRHGLDNPRVRANTRPTGQCHQNPHPCNDG